MAHKITVEVSDEVFNYIKSTNRKVKGSLGFQGGRWVYLGWPPNKKREQCKKLVLPHGNAKVTDKVTTLSLRIRHGEVRWIGTAILDESERAVDFIEQLTTKS